MLSTTARCGSTSIPWSRCRSARTTTWWTAGCSSSIATRQGRRRRYVVISDPLSRSTTTQTAKTTKQQLGNCPPQKGSSSQDILATRIVSLRPSATCLLGNQVCIDSSKTNDGGLLWTAAVTMVAAIVAATTVTLFETNRRNCCQMEAAAATTPSTFQVDTLYELTDDILGEGAFGIVYRAKRKVDGITIALKEINNNHSDPLMEEEFQREINALKILSEKEGHPHICKLYDLHQTSDKNYVVMELIEGGELLEHLCLNGAYSEQDASRFVLQLAHAMNYMHTIHGIAHSDLKCENLMLSSWNIENAKLKVVDFGCAVTIKKDGTTVDIQEFRGTSAYCAPERLRDEKGLPTLPNDMFAVGVIVYILLTGTHPFDPYGDISDEELNKTLRAISPDENGQVLLDVLLFDDRTVELSESSKDLLRKLMHPNPKKRMTAQELVNHRWVQGLDASYKTMAGSDQKLVQFWQRQFQKSILQQYSITQNGGTLSDENLQHIFQQIDLDGSGSLDPNELRIALRQLGISEDNANLMIASTDTDQSGEIDFDEFCTVMRQSFDDGPGVDVSTTTKTNDNRKRFQTAILTALAANNKSNNNTNNNDDNDSVNADEKHLRRIFDIIDLDGNGTLSYDELTTFLVRLGVERDEINKIIETVDTDSSGYVDWQEFQTVMEHTKK